MTVRMCWAPTAKDGVCGGEVKWTEHPDRWSGHCGKCGASGRAASGERREFEAQKGKVA